MASESVDGMDVVAVEVAASRAIGSIRRTSEPFLLECRTYRFRAHSMFDAQLYRTKQEIEAWREHDPIQQLQSWLAQNGLMHADEVLAVEAEIATEIANAVAFAEAGTWESVDDLERFTLMDQVPQ
jgi:TPP-dependent pyruvate/acetoin dehydrogenase alpha subunit